MYAQAHLAGFISQDEYKHQIAEGADHRTPFVPIPCREILNAASGDVGLMGVHNCPLDVQDCASGFGLTRIDSVSQYQIMGVQDCGHQSQIMGVQDYLGW